MVTSQISFRSIFIFTEQKNNHKQCEQQKHSNDMSSQTTNTQTKLIHLEFNQSKLYLYRLFKPELSKVITHSKNKTYLGGYEKHITVKVCNKKNVWKEKGRNEPDAKVKWCDTDLEQLQLFGQSFEAVTIIQSAEEQCMDQIF